MLQIRQVHTSLSVAIFSSTGLQYPTAFITVRPSSERHGAFHAAWHGWRAAFGKCELDDSQTGQALPNANIAGPVNV